MLGSGTQRRETCKDWTNCPHGGLSSARTSPLTFKCWKPGSQLELGRRKFHFHFRMCFRKENQIQTPHVCGGYFPVTRQVNVYLGLKPPVRQENSGSSLPSLPERFFLQITAPATTAPVTTRRTRPTMMPMVRKEV